MNLKNVISPENRQVERKKNFFYKISPKIIRRLYDNLQYRFLLKKWNFHADNRKFDWNWKDDNFNRIAVVNVLVSKFSNPAYLEIGCAGNALFNSVPVLNKIGVDPASGGNIRKTSDEFFESNQLKFDVIFIDGLHTYEQVRRDIINALQCLNQGGWIALHDMLPRDWIEQHVPIISRGAWTGDVWKVAFELCNTDGIDFKILKIDHGVGVIKILDKNVKLKNLLHELSSKEFSFYYDHIDNLPLVDWEEAYDWLK
jgi:hypothetical protein